VKPLFLIIFSIVALARVQLLSLLNPEKFKYKYIEKTLRYMFGMTYIVMVAQLYNKLPKIILGILSSPIYVAYWGIMEKVREPLLQFQSSMLRPLIPILSEMKSAKVLSSDKIFQAVRLQYVFISFIALLCIMHIDMFIKYWIGDEFILVSELIQIWFLPFLFPNAGIFLMMYYAEGKTKINSIYITVNTFFSLSIAYFGLLWFNDIKMFVWTFSLIIVDMTFIVLWVYLRYYKVHVSSFFIKAIAKPALIIVGYLMIYKYMHPFFSFDLYGFLESIIFSILLYGFLFFIFMPKEDFQLILKLIKKKKTI
jgi:O-antigen/teichoic acid export membrane protein